MKALAAGAFKVPAALMVRSFRHIWFGRMEKPMAQLALQQAFNDATILPPTFDLAAAMSFAKTARDFVQAIDRFETEALLWRTRMARNSAELRVRIDQATHDLPPETAWAELKPRIEAGVRAAEAGLEAFGTPLEQDPRFLQSLARLKRVSPDLARYFRRQLKRGELIRQKQVGAYAAIRDALLAIEWDYDPDAHGGPVFETQEDLLAFLHA